MTLLIGGYDLQGSRYGSTTTAGSLNLCCFASTHVMKIGVFMFEWSKSALGNERETNKRIIKTLQLYHTSVFVIDSIQPHVQLPKPRKPPEAKLFTKNANHDEVIFCNIPFQHDDADNADYGHYDDVGHYYYYCIRCTIVVKDNDNYFYKDKIYYGSTDDRWFIPRYVW